MFIKTAAITAVALLTLSAVPVMTPSHGTNIWFCWMFPRACES